MFVSSGHVSIQGTTIRDMQQSISISSSGSVDILNFDATAAGVDVIIDNPSGTNFNGAIVDGGIAGAEIDRDPVRADRDRSVLLNGHR